MKINVELKDLFYSIKKYKTTNKSLLIINFLDITLSDY